MPGAERTTSRSRLLTLLWFGIVWLAALAPLQTVRADAPHATLDDLHAVDAQTSGATTVAQAEPRSISPLARLGQRGVGVVGTFLMLVLLGMAMVTFVRPNLEIVADTATHSLGRSLVAGLLGQLLVLPTLALLLIGLAVTIIGVVLIPFTLIATATLTLIALLGGLLALAYAMGETMTRRRLAAGLRASPNGYRYMLTGLGAVACLWVVWVGFGWVPLAGPLLLGLAGLSTWVLSTIGFGALLLSRGGSREHFAGPLIPATLMTDEHLWATPRLGVPAVTRPPTTPRR